MVTGISTGHLEPRVGLQSSQVFEEESLPNWKLLEGKATVVQQPLPQPRASPQSDQAAETALQAPLPCRRAQVLWGPT